jgi:hypothetical protein
MIADSSSGKVIYRGRHQDVGAGCRLGEGASAPGSMIGIETVSILGAIAGPSLSVKTSRIFIELRQREAIVTSALLAAANILSALAV